jgi:hypothetical protein
MTLISFGGEVWTFVPYPVWLIGACLALHAGWFAGIAIVDVIRRRKR